MKEVRYSFCHICEATCGLRVTVEDNRVCGIEPDPEHVATNGYACMKGTRFAEVQHSPDRVVEPLKRVGDRWEAISWDQAIAEIGGKIRELVDRHGNQTLAHMMGSPAGASAINPGFSQAFFAGLGSRQTYGVGSVDCNNKFRVNQDMYGSPFRLTFPDAAHTQFLMLLGSNPAVSQMSLVHMPRSIEKLRAIERRGGRVVFVNPRRTESAEQVGEQVFIRPDTDVYFIAAFCREWIATGGVDEERLATTMRGFEQLKAAVSAWTPERAGAVTGIEAGTIRELVQAHRAADGAALYMSTGVNQGTHGTLCHWLLESINAISGNLDRRGGTLMGRGIFDWPALAKKSGQFESTAQSPTGGFRAIVDTFPVGVLADEILKPDHERVTGLIVAASNPVLNCPNPDGRLQEALGKLELLVSIDLFRNETANLAHYILPSTTFLERADVPYAIQTFVGSQPVRYVHYVDPVLEPPPGVREEWWIYTRLARASGVRLHGSRLVNALLQFNAWLFSQPWGRRLAVTPPRMIGLMLMRLGLGYRTTHLKRYPHGRLLDENRPGDFLGTDRVLTADGRVNLAPTDFVEAAAGLEQSYAREVQRRGEFKLISKRELRSMNSWLRNYPGYVRDSTNYLYLHPEDAERLGLSDNDLAAVRSESGAVQAPVRVSDEIMPGAAALPHGWGHADADGMPLAQRHAGVNSNLLAGDGPQHIERLSGIAHLSGIFVDISKAERSAA